MQNDKPMRRAGLASSPPISLGDVTCSNSSSSRRSSSENGYDSSSLDLPQTLTSGYLRPHQGGWRTSAMLHQSLIPSRLSLSSHASLKLDAAPKSLKTSGRKGRTRRDVGDESIFDTAISGSSRMRATPKSCRSTDLTKSFLGQHRSPLSISHTPQGGLDAFEVPEVQLQHHHSRPPSAPAHPIRVLTIESYSAIQAGRSTRTWTTHFFYTTPSTKTIRHLMNLGNVVPTPTGTIQLHLPFYSSSECKTPLPADLSISLAQTSSSSSVVIPALATATSQTLMQESENTALPAELHVSGSIEASKASLAEFRETPTSSDAEDSTASGLELAGQAFDLLRRHGAISKQLARKGHPSTTPRASDSSSGADSFSARYCEEVPTSKEVSKQRSMSYNRRDRSLTFETEPLINDVRKNMERQLWDWVGPMYQSKQRLPPSTRGKSKVMESFMIKNPPLVVVKGVSLSLPPSPFSSNLSFSEARSGGLDGSFDLETRQLLPSICRALWELRKITGSHLSSIVDVYSLAAYLNVQEHIENESSRRTSSDSDRNSGSPFAMTPYAKLLHQLNSKGDNTTRFPITLFSNPISNFGRSVVPRPPSATALTSSTTTTTSTTSSSSSAPSSAVCMPSLTEEEVARKGWAIGPTHRPIPPRRPAVFLYARLYIPNSISLAQLLVSRLGRWAPFVGVTTDPPKSPGVTQGSRLVKRSATVTRETEERCISKSLCRNPYAIIRRCPVSSPPPPLSSASSSSTSVAFSKAPARVQCLLKQPAAFMGLDEAADVARQMIDAVLHLHKFGFVHGNLKPSNILISGIKDTKLSRESNSSGVAGGCSVRVRITDCLLPLFPYDLLDTGEVLTLLKKDEVLAFSRKPSETPLAAEKLLETLRNDDGSCGADARSTPFHSGDAYVCLRTNSQHIFQYDGQQRTGSLFASRAKQATATDMSEEQREQLLLQHLLAPEHCLLCVSDTKETEEVRVSRGGSGIDRNGATSTSESMRFWVDLESAKPSTDAYAVGVLLFLMVTGHLPPLPRYNVARRRHLWCLATQQHCDVYIRTSLATIPAKSVEDAAIAFPIICEKYRHWATCAVKRDASICTAMMKSTRQLRVLLGSAQARLNCPLVLALAKAGMPPSLMTLLVGLLDPNPRRRMTLAQARKEDFFRTYGTQRAASRHPHSAIHTSMQEQRQYWKSSNALPRGMGASARYGHHVSDYYKELNRVQQRVKRREKKVTQKNAELAMTSEPPLSSKSSVRKEVVVCK